MFKNWFKKKSKIKDLCQKYKEGEITLDFYTRHEIRELKEQIKDLIHDNYLMKEDLNNLYKSLPDSQRETYHFLSDLIIDE